MTNPVPIKELEEALRIDENELDHALSIQPDSFYRVSRQLVLQISRRDAAKQSLEEVEAETDLKIRAKLKKLEEKFTEREVDARKLMSPEVKEATAQLSELTHSVNQLSALKEAFIQRGYALKSLVELYTANYFGDAQHSSSNAGMNEHKADSNRRAMNAERKKSREREKWG